MNSRMTEKEVGKYYIDRVGEVWQLKSYCSEPTVIMEKVNNKEQRGGTVGCLNLEGFTLLIPEK